VGFGLIYLQIDLTIILLQVILKTVFLLVNYGWIQKHIGKITSIYTQILHKRIDKRKYLISFFRMLISFLYFVLGVFLMAKADSKNFFILVIYYC
jgi:hypothetical protein